MCVCLQFTRVEEGKEKMFIGWVHGCESVCASGYVQVSGLAEAIWLWTDKKCEGAKGTAKILANVTVII